jgi:acetyltransferase-like isoleucine patch superfamily enzyme
MNTVKFAEKGNNVTIYPYVVFINERNIHIKNNVIISEFVWIHGGIKTLIGNFIHIASYSSIAGGGVCILEDFVGLSAGVKIITGSELIKGEGLTNPTIPQKFRAIGRSFVHLKKHSFIASDVVIHPGITIGEGAVIGSNSTVTKDIVPWSINVGSPTKQIGQRNPENILKLQDQLFRESSIEPLDVTPYLKLKTTQNFIPTIDN